VIPVVGNKFAGCGQEFHEALDGCVKTLRAWCGADCQRAMIGRGGSCTRRLWRELICAERDNPCRALHAHCWATFFG
jgi:hypothetical protein